VVEKLAPVPDAGLPPVAVQANVNGAVLPVAAAVHAIAVPTVPLAGQLMDTLPGSGAIVIVADALAVFALPSVAVTDTV